MISRAILLSAVMGWSGSNLLSNTPQPNVPLTSAQLQAKAKYKSVSNICQKKKKSKTVKDMCKRWEEQQNA
jgi:hypothetical protein